VTSIDAARMTELGRHGLRRERPKPDHRIAAFSGASGADDDGGVVQRQVWRVEEHDLPELSVDVQAERRYGGVEGHVHTSTGMHGRRNRHRMS
jgi:hypothetical protein